MFRTFALAVITFHVLTASLSAPSFALACTPPPGGLPHLTVAEHVYASDVVIEGTVIAVADQNYVQAATIQVVQYFKGSGPATLTAEGYGPSSVCLSPVYAGDHFIFYLTLDSTGAYHALYLSQFDAVAPADSQTIAEAVAASGQPPFVVTPNDSISAAPTPAPPLNDVAIAFTEAYATTYAAATQYQSDPAGASAAMTEAGATLQVLYNTTPGPGCGPSAHTLAEHVAAADVIFEGIVSSAVDYGAVIQVVQYLKVGPNPQVAAQLVFDKSEPCYAPPQPGDHFIYFAIGEPNLVMYALDSVGYLPTASPDPDTIAAITAASGQAPMPMQSAAGIGSMLTATAVNSGPVTIDQVLTEAWATSIAVGTNYPADPAGQSAIATQAMATIAAAYTQLVFATPLPYPTSYPPPYYPPPIAPTPAPTALEAVGLIGVGAVIGLIIGGLGGIVIGLLIGRWRE